MALLGAFLIIIAVLLIIIARQGYIFHEYKKHGKTQRANVVKKYIQTRDEMAVSQLKTNRYNAKQKINYLLDVTLFENGNASGGKFITAYAKATVSDIEGLNKGQQVSILYLPNNPKTTAILKTSLEEIISETSLLQKYRNEAVMVEASVDEVNVPQKTVRVMFMSTLSLKIGDYKATTLDVDKSVWDSVKPGEKIDVVYLPDNPGSKVFAKKMIEKGAVNFYLMAILAALALILGALAIVKYGNSWKTYQKSKVPDELNYR